MVGSVKVTSSFNAEADSQALRTAMKGAGTDEKAIITVLAARSQEQLAEIVKVYKTAFGRDLIADLKSELSANFEAAVLAWMQPRHVFDAHTLRHAMKGAGTDEKAIIEVLSTRSNAEIKAIVAHYEKEYKRNLEKDLMSDTSGDFKRFCVSLVNSHRDESPTIDAAKVKADADALFKAGEGRWGTDESEFNRILASRSPAHLRAVMDEYKKIANHDLETAIKREFSGNIEDGWLAVVKSARNISEYFAEALYKAMKGAGTDDKTLVRIVVTRAHVDMEEIKKAFQAKYSKTLYSFIDGDCSGDYKRFLLAVVGN